MDDYDHLFDKALSAKTCQDVESIIHQLGDRIEWVPLGNNKGNFGVVSMGAEPWDGLTERITNAIDAIIELEVERAPQLKKSVNPRKAVESVYGFQRGYLRNGSQDKIRELASNIKVKFLDSESQRRPTVEVWDRGIGQHPSDFPRTLLGLNDDYKVSKLYLMGAFGQGGQTSFQHCQYGIIISRKDQKLLVEGQDDLAGWSIVRYRDPTTSSVIYKKGHWEYCVRKDSGRVLTAAPASIRVAFDHGTIIRLVSYDFSKGTSDVLQPASTAWSYLSQSMFDPLLPLVLYEGRERYEKRGRALTGLAQRLWGGGKGEKVTISVSDTYDLNLGRRGSVTINYWALSPSDETENWRDAKKGFVSGPHAVFITLNGQRHGYESKSFLKDTVGLTFSNDYLIIQIDCDELTNQAKKELLSATRDRLKEGEFKEELMDAVADHLRQDRNVLAFERERKSRIMSARTKRDTDVIRRLVGRFIARNPELSDLIQSDGKSKTDSITQPKEKGEHEPDDGIRPEELEVPVLRETPTYLRIANRRIPIPIEQGGNALVRLETDAVDAYCEDAWDSTFRCLHRNQAMMRRSCSRIRNGKISYYVHCPSMFTVGRTEELHFELDLPGGGVLTTDCTLRCVQPYERKKDEGKRKLPEPNIQTISKEEDPEIWGAFGWNEESVGRVIIGGVEKPGIYVSLDNRHLRSALKSKRLDDDTATSVQDRYTAGVAYYLLLREADRMNRKKDDRREEEVDTQDDSPELARLAQTVSAMSLPIESL